VKITDIQAREIFDSRGIPTIECSILMDDGMILTSSVPSGTSRSMYEAYARRDGGKRLNGLGVLSAVETIHTIIAPMFVGKKPHVIDMDIQMLEMDNTSNKSGLGANSMLAVSMSMAKAQAYRQGITLHEFIAELCGNKSVSMPIPCFNFLSGGVHASNKLGIQEFMIVPVGSESFQHAMDTAAQIFYAVRGILEKRNLFAGYSYEGGYIVSLENNMQACDILVDAIQQAGFTDNVHLAIDVAASYLYDKDKDLYLWEGDYLSREELVNWYKQLVKKHPIVFIEDGLRQDDIVGWRYMTDELCADISIVGDDIFATDSQRIWEGIEIGCATSAIIKPNQIGTLIETIQAVNLCQEYDWSIIASHRSGETNDSFIADFSVGSGAHYIKAGACSRGERVAKYNRLLQIERELFL
jgi:enolase